MYNNENIQLGFNSQLYLFLCCESTGSDFFLQIIKLFFRLSKEFDQIPVDCCGVNKRTTWFFQFAVVSAEGPSPAKRSKLEGIFIT